MKAKNNSALTQLFSYLLLDFLALLDVAFFAVARLPADGLALAELAFPVLAYGD